MKTSRQPSKTNTSSITNMCKQLSYRIVMAMAFAAMLTFTQLAGAASYIWAVPGGGNWSTLGNWSPNSLAGGPLAADSVTFNNSTTNSSPIINNTADLGFAGTVSNLQYNNIDNGVQAGWNVTQIPSGQVLTVTHNLIAGGGDAISGTKTNRDNVVGGGTLMVTATNMMVQIGSSSARNGATCFFDL